MVNLVNIILNELKVLQLYFCFERGIALVGHQEKKLQYPLCAPHSDMQSHLPALTGNFYSGPS